MNIKLISGLAWECGFDVAPELLFGDMHFKILRICRIDFQIRRLKHLKHG